MTDQPGNSPAATKGGEKLAGETARGSHDFQVTGSELLLDAPIIAVRRDEVTMPGGKSAYREIVEHFGAVSVVAYDGARIRMIHQYRHSVGERLWELPAGLLDTANEDPLEAAARELQEEVGLAARQWDLLTDVVSSPGFCEEAVRIYLARDLYAVEQPDTDDEEADMTSQWVPLDETVSWVMSGQVHNAVTVSAILMANQVLRYGASPRNVAEPFTLRPLVLAHRREEELRKAGLPTDNLKRIVKK